MAQDKGLPSIEKALIAARAADSKKAFVIATAQNNRQIDAVLDAIEEAETKEAGVKPYSVEGAQEGFWALQDYGDFVVHVFQPEGRDYYRLEEIWNDAPLVDFAPVPASSEEA